MKNKIVGISIANSEDAESYGFSDTHLKDALVEFARFLLINDFDLAYGGHLQKQGYTKYLFDLIRMYKKDINLTTPRIHSFLSWPFSCDLTPAFQSKYKAEVAFSIVDNIKDQLEDKDEHEKIALRFLKHFNLLTAKDKYYIARGLYDMREEMNNAIQSRIALGGKTTSFMGFMPGILRESYFAIKSKTPLFLIGAFGGCSKKIINVLKGQNEEVFTLDYQMEHHEGYKSLYDELNKSTSETNEFINFKAAVSQFKNSGIKGLKNGLTTKENEELFETNYLPKMIFLVLKGLKNC